MSNVDGRDAVLKMAEALGLSASDLAAVASSAASSAEAPTVAQFAPRVIEACSAKALPTYRPHFVRLVDAFGDRQLSEVTVTDLSVLRDTTMANAAAQKVAAAEAKGRPLVSYELDAHGRGAGENSVRAFRFFFKTARRERLVWENVAMEVEVPKRLPAPERPLTTEELGEVALIWCTTGNDPELDTVMFEFHRKTAARREGGLNLRLGDLDERRGSVTITEKFGKTRELPYDVAGLRRLRSFAVRRGAATASDHVFRSSRHTAISRRRYETIYDRLDAHTSWTERIDLGVHWIRHTTLDDVRTVADSRVAAAYAGHADASQGTIGLYNKISFDELCGAFEAIFGPRFDEKDDPLDGGS